MTASNKDYLTIFPPFDSHSESQPNQHDKHDSPLDFGIEDEELGTATMTNGEPYIKAEPSDHFDPYQFAQFHHPEFGHTIAGLNINPANLTNGNGGMAQSFGQQTNTGSSFNMGHSAIADDELLDLDIHGTQHNGGFDMQQGMNHFFSQQMQQSNTGMFSHTPDGAPVHSPFNSGFDFSNFRPMSGQQSFAGGHSMPHQAGSLRPHMQHMDRKMSDSRSPATPLQIGDDFNDPGMAIHHHQRQQGSIGGSGWDSTPSGHSWNESSPFPSPANGQTMHPQISEVLKNNPNHQYKLGAASLPTKMEGHGSGMHTQEAKRRRRRESHNAVERRRRDNINERIHDLGGLVPQHRLEDEKVRKHLQTNAPLSPSIAHAGMSPPSATSLLAGGGQGRRATGAGNITQGLPVEDKDKGPNKGDILNGSVAWARDLMWYTHLKLRQEQELKDRLQQLGQPWPFEQTEDEKRMHSEICEVLNRHAPHGGFGYSRAPGSALRVPGFTNVAGESINVDGQVIGNGFPPAQQQSLSPGFQSGGSGMSSGQMSHQQQNHYWNGGEFKEEDEYGMDV